MNGTTVSSRQLACLVASKLSHVGRRRWSSLHTVTVLDALFLTGMVQEEYPYPCQWTVLLLHR